MRKLLLAVAVLCMAVGNAHAATQWVGLTQTDPAPNGEYEGQVKIFAWGDDLYYILEVKPSDPEKEIWIKSGETGLSAAEEKALEIAASSGQGTDSVKIVGGQVETVIANDAP